MGFKIIFLTFLLITISSTGFAIEIEKKAATIGQGGLTCKKYLKASGRKLNDFIVWVQGYFSAYNAIVPGMHNITAEKDYFWVKDRLKELCKEKPEQYFNDAVDQLAGELHPQGVFGKSASLKVSEN